MRLAPLRGSRPFTWAGLPLGFVGDSHALDHARVWLHEGQALLGNHFSLSEVVLRGVVSRAWKRPLDYTS